MDLLARGNDALNTNPPIGVDLSLSVNGSDWLWAVTAVHLLFFFIVLVPSFTSPESKRVFNYTLSIALLIGSACYYAQASDLGWDAVQQENGLTRQIFYARYINWTVSFPAIALSLGLMSGVSWTTIILNIVLSWTWVLTYLAGAYTTTTYKWGFFAFGTFAYIILAMSTLNESRESAEVLGYSRHYMILSGWVNLLWLLYPVAWGLSEGANVIGVTRGFIFFGALDVLLLPVLSVGFLVLSPGWDWAKLQLDFSEYRGVRSIDNQPTKETAPSTEDNNSTAI